MRGHCVNGTRICTFPVLDTMRLQHQTRAHTAQALSWCNKVPLTHKLQPRGHHTQGAKNPKRLRSPSQVRFSMFFKMDGRATCDGCGGWRRLC